MYFIPYLGLWNQNVIFLEWSKTEIQTDFRDENHLKCSRLEGGLRNGTIIRNKINVGELRIKDGLE
jgi:hypothetical protein